MTSQAPGKVAVFCGSSAGNDPVFADAARSLGRAIAARGLELVYGGGSIGLMGILADETLARKGRVIGVIPRTLFVREVGHRGLTECRLVDTMHERKAIMADLASAFVTLPGGYGTLDETFEALTWAQLGIHSKPVVLVNVAGFFGPLLAAVDGATAAGFLRPEHRALLKVARTPEEALDIVSSWKPPVPAERWLPREAR